MSVDGPMAEPVPVLSMRVDGVCAAEFAAVPQLEFALTIRQRDGVEVCSVTLDTQVRILPAHRAYDEASRERLAELFGRDEEWSRNLRSLLWARTVTQVPGFAGETAACVRVACTYDFEVAVAKYFHGLREGEVPLEFLFSGTVFYRVGGRLLAARIPWDSEAEFRMPVRVWWELMDRYFPGGAWLRLDRERFDRLHAYRVRHTLAGWEDVVDRLLKEGGG